MRNYRAYFLGDDRRIFRRVDLHCTNDEDAKIQAQQLMDGHSVELWDGARKIAEFTLRIRKADSQVLRFVEGD